LGKDREETLRHLYVDFASALYMERASRHIFGSQIDALNFITGAGGRCQKAQLLPYYVNAAAQHPSFYSNYPFDQWFAFLISQNLVTLDGDSVALAPGGHAIVPYMQVRGYLQTRPIG
jgi:hypothetical protein